MIYYVNGFKITYEPEGITGWGDDIILSQQGIDLTKNHSWHKAGYTIQSLFDEELFTEFKRNTLQLLSTCLKRVGLNPDRIDSLDQYHHLIPNQKTHLEVINQAKLLSVSNFPIPISQLESRISDLLKENVVVHNPYDNQKIFHFRIVRPQSGDHNPLHRDVWLDDYDNCLNLYIPIVGSDENSSLIIIPGSHLWAENRIEKTTEGALINGVKFNVPAVTQLAGEYSFIRANPLENEVLIFSPYLIHGGSVNLNPDSTRISIEIRLWRK